MKDTNLNSKYTINCKGTLLDLSHPKVMAIINCTPDSFYKPSREENIYKILKKVESEIKNGADIIDIGGYSSRPGAINISEKEEINRILPAISAITKEFPETPLSIDSFRSSVVKEAINNGASIINDISAGEIDNKMFETVLKLNVPYIMMHMIGTPQTMQNETDNYENITLDLIKYFTKKINQLSLLGINDIIIDPGFGFSKTIDQNYEVFKHLSLLKTLNLPILCGISRKSMIYKHLNINAESSISATSALHLQALLNGANILRVHDSLEARQMIDLFDKIH